MLTLEIDRPKNEEKWSGRKLDRSSIQMLLPDKESARVVGPDGELIAVVLREAFSLKELKAYWKVIKEINLKTNNRGTASGIKAVPRIRLDGSISNTTGVPKGQEVVSGVIGYYPRYPRIPFCRECAWNQHHPDEFRDIVPMVQKVSRLHKKHARESYDYQHKVVKTTSRDFVIPKTIYTTITVNKNFQTAAHLDAKNLPDGMAPMLLMEKGKFAGGEVVLPEWGVGVRLRQGDLIFFRNMIDMHGNLPILPISKGSTRCTLVFYYREEMIKCGTAAQELERAKSGENFSANLNEETS